MVGDNEFVCLEDFEAHAQKVLSKNVWDYYRSGADEEVTLGRNRSAFKNILIRPRCLVDVSKRNTSVSLMNGRFQLAYPIAIAPTAVHCLAHPDGEIATVKAANSTGTLMTVSSGSTTSIEDIAIASPNAKKWLQFYSYDDRPSVIEKIQNAEAAGYSAFVVTIDAPMIGKRREDIRNKFALPPHLKFANYQTIDPKKPKRWLMGNEPVGWEFLAWLRTLTKLPIIMKGILTREDAIEALKHKADAIMVSNHGARQLDSVPATIEALPEIVEAVAGRCDVYLDGGIRTGGDVFKALALGAKCVFIGRPIIYGLAHSGESGVRKALKILQDEFDLCMALAGVRNVQEINRRSVIFQSELKSKL